MEDAARGTDVPDWRDPLILECFLMNSKSSQQHTHTEIKGRHSNKWAPQGEKQPIMFYRQRSKVEIHVDRVILWTLKTNPVVCCGRFSDVKYLLCGFSKRNSTGTSCLFKAWLCLSLMLT